MAKGGAILVRVVTKFQFFQGAAAIQIHNAVMVDTGETPQTRHSAKVKNIAYGQGLRAEELELGTLTVLKRIEGFNPLNDVCLSGVDDNATQAAQSFQERQVHHSLNEGRLYVTIAIERRHPVKRGMVWSVTTPSQIM